MALYQETKADVAWGGTKSRGWKDVTMRIVETGEELKVPVMIATKTVDMRTMLAEMLGLSPPEAHRIEFFTKVGPSTRRTRVNEEIPTNVIVKGITSFAKSKMVWPYPYCIIGAGHHGLRLAVHYCRQGVEDFVLFDRLHAIGGNAWVTLANKFSQTQSEGVHYQLCYDPIDGNTAGLKKDYGCWPSTATILKHFEDVCDDYGVTPHCRLNTNVAMMEIVEHPTDWSRNHYDLTWESWAPGALDEEGNFQCSCICLFPGAMVNHRVHHWPGEEDFGGQVTYGHANMFDYQQVKDESVIIVGMGAFANENIRTCIEHGVKKCFLVVRHLNVFLPRAVCWFVNQSINAPPGAMVFGMMQPIYKLIGWDIFTMPTIVANKDRTNVLLKQNARWGTGDIFFIAMYFGKAETIVAEIKRLKHHTAVLTDGTVLSGVKHLMKCLGFSGDFTADRLMRTKQHVGIFPDGDFKRTVFAEFLAIDAGRFGGTAFAPSGSSLANYLLWYHQHPREGFTLAKSGNLPTNKARPEIGKPAYDFDPRQGSLGIMILGGFSPELGEFDAVHNTPFKRASMWYLQYPEKHIRECSEDWQRYCKMCVEQGCEKPIPDYPYTAEDLHEIARAEEALAPPPAAADGAEGSCVLYGGEEMMMPAKQVFRARGRSPAPSKKDTEMWLQEAQQTARSLRRATALAS